MGRLTQKAFGQHIGISQPAVARLVSHGVIDLARGLDQCRLDYCEHLRSVAAGHHSDDGNLDLIEEKALLTRAQRQLAEIQIAKSEGDLVSRDQFSEYVCYLGSVEKQLLLGFPSKLSGILADVTTAAEVSKILTAEVRSALEFIRNGEPADLYEDFVRKFNQ